MVCARFIRLLRTNLIERSVNWRTKFAGVCLDCRVAMNVSFFGLSDRLGAHFCHPIWSY